LDLSSVKPLSKPTRLEQQRIILKLFNYRICNHANKIELENKASRIATISTHPVYISRKALQQLLVRESTLSDLAALKQDAKSFRYRQMCLELQKRLTLAPLYTIAKTMLPNLDLSQLNIAYYASLANFYSI
jgi:hypothetical protein